ncbi:MAG: AAA family ATPase [Chitinophagaceae bacterium]|nr:AAA family ATPase [Chitinophagaceae bacterium]
MVVLVMGLPGSGKSYFAVRLAELTEAVYINSDRIRKELLSDLHYTDEEKLMVYDEMLRLAERSVTDRRQVVLDATFYTRSIRDKFTQALQELGETAFIEVVADEELIRERLKRPREDSDANFEVYREIREEWEPLEDEHLVLRSTDENIDSMLDEALEYLQHGMYDK